MKELNFKNMRAPTQLETTLTSLNKSGQKNLLTFKACYITYDHSKLTKGHGNGIPYLWLLELCIQ